MNSMKRQFENICFIAIDWTTTFKKNIFDQAVFWLEPVPMTPEFQRVFVISNQGKVLKAFRGSAKALTGLMSSPILRRK